MTHCPATVLQVDHAAGTHHFRKVARIIDTLSPWLDEAAVGTAGMGRRSCSIMRRASARFVRRHGFKIHGAQTSVATTQRLIFLPVRILLRRESGLPWSLT